MEKADLLSEGFLSGRTRTHWRDNGVSAEGHRLSHLMSEKANSVAGERQGAEGDP